MKYRIEGIYDKRTINHLKGCGVSDFVIDFRPRSLNFLQQHIYTESLEPYLKEESVYFHFENEKSFVIQKIINDANISKGIKGQLKLEFSDLLGQEFYEQFNTPYIWHYDPTVQLDDFIRSNLCQGISIDFKLIENIYESNQLRNFCSNLYSKLYTLKKDGIDIFLIGLWTSDILPSFIEYLDFSYFSLPINPSVESCYRNVDLTRLSDNFLKLKSSIL